MFGERTFTAEERRLAREHLLGTMAAEFAIETSADRPSRAGQQVTTLQRSQQSVVAAQARPATADSRVREMPDPGASKIAAVGNALIRILRFYARGR
jgi:hypothetical protein